MVKEFIVMGVSATIVAAALYALIKHRQTKEENGEEIETIFFSELTSGEIKSWFKEHMEGDGQKGVVFCPTKENTAKWKVKMPENENMLIQIVYDVQKDSIVFYREIEFFELSPKLKELLDENEGTIVFKQ